MRELIRANDPVLISFVGVLLTEAGIAHVVVDQNMSVLEGSVGILAARVLVGHGEFAEARRVLVEAGIGHEISRWGGPAEDGGA
ncbi:MAG: DUF2007 domain-containing protein [Rhizobiales bacterium]|nr:DUF2007 domain-containing protein [Hyphomicrobiales bacterium]